MRMIALSETDVSKGPLALVNAGHPAKADGNLRLLPLVEDGSIYLEKKAASLLGQVFRTLGSKGRIVPVSGYRSRNEQTHIYNCALSEHGEAFTNKYVALPDCSEHQTGLAVDLAEHSEDIDFLCPSFPYTGVCGEFRDLAAKYGFIERYGKDKEAITGIACEPWHFRYVGYPHSLLMQETHLCLEEYITFLRRYPYRGGHLFFKQTEIFFADAEEARAGLVLPEACTQLSGNNVDGFIVTVWRTAL